MKKFRKIIGRIILACMSLIWLVCFSYLCICFLPASFFPHFVGVLEIPDVGIEVPVVEVPKDIENNKTIKFMVNPLRKFYVDKDNCAVQYYSEGASYTVDGDKLVGCTVIGDHRAESFEPIDECTQGMMVRFTRPDGTIDYYEVVSVFEGINAGTDLTYKDGKSVIHDNPGAIILYSCMDLTAIPVYIVILQPRN